MASSIQIQVDYDKCVGSRICTAIAPKVFGLNDNGQACVLDVDGDMLEVIRMAAEGCPVAAINVQEVDGEKGDAE
jgi:ferredoxin